MALVVALEVANYFLRTVSIVSVARIVIHRSTYQFASFAFGLLSDLDALTFLWFNSAILPYRR